MHNNLNWAYADKILFFQEWFFTVCRVFETHIYESSAEKGLFWGTMSGIVTTWTEVIFKAANFHGLTREYLEIKDQRWGLALISQQNDKVKDCC